MKKSLILLFLFSLIGGGYWFLSKENPTPQPPQKVQKDYTQYAKEALKYCKNNNASTDFFILIDFAIHSGKKRMFIWDFKQGKITESFLVSHGSGKMPTAKDLSKDNPVFSNVEESHCSSLGKYLIGRNKVPSVGYGEKYLLYGKDKTNSNALKRNVVIHPWKRMPNEEPYPKGTPESWGCPAVSIEVFNILHQKIQSTPKQVLLWAIY